LVCHDNMKLSHFYTGSSGRKYFHDFNGNGMLDDFDCVVCHWQPDMDGLVELGTDFAKFNGHSPSSVNDFCFECHSSNWNRIKDKPLADVSGSGKGEVRVSVSESPLDIESKYFSDWHGQGISLNGTFKNVSIDGKLLYYSGHSALDCIVCHNPHASNNDKLVIETVGETLSMEVEVKQVDNSANVKKVIIDPDFYGKFPFEGEVLAKSRDYNLSKWDGFRDYVNLPVENDNSSSVDNERITFSSLCAACHEGAKSYSPINGLGLPIDLSGHYSGRCDECHIHGRRF